MTVAHALEAHVPFFEKQVVEAVMCLDPRRKNGLNAEPHATIHIRCVANGWILFLPFFRCDRMTMAHALEARVPFFEKKKSLER